MKIKVKMLDKKVPVPFKKFPRQYLAVMRNEAGAIVEAFTMNDKRRLKRLVRNCGYKGL
jgi:hypothetical protein